MGDSSADPGTHPTLDRQPRRALPPIISEYAATSSLMLPSTVDVKVGNVVWLPVTGHMQRSLTLWLGVMAAQLVK
eukprot:6464134-Amphidinium_carterae.1